ncbi:MAG: bifunctional transaldolase/phosoglucose isomerase [Actinobacteria bacterium]|nr:bifunctional transaldolase/phosoglucose isomerase [Actinomycetota bacterium]
MNRLQELHEAGQAIWLDFLRRGLISTGELERMVNEWYLTGVTSNPSIFKKAIGGSKDYDDAIAEISEDEHDALDVFYELALEDIRNAADVLRPVYDRLDRKDGFVSFELEADLAQDTEGSIAKATELFERIGKPNVFIKVPGTPEGVKTVEELIAAGVNVNITLLFSVSAYEKVALAYIRGLERLAASGGDLGAVTSVASFFVSRVDSAVDPQLPAGSPIKGTIALANAKVAYQRFLSIFSGPRWEKLAAAGAHVQRPLWASTGTKNKAYSDVLYVEELVGPDTVNTMPQQTMEAFADHGNVRPTAVTEGVAEAISALGSLPDHGIDLEKICDKLVEDGLEAFHKDFQALLETLERKIERVCAGRARWSESLGELQPKVDAAVEDLTNNEIVPRMWRRDHTVWKPEPTEISDRLGWMTIIEPMVELLPMLEDFAGKARADGFTHCVVLGMGGSSLIAEVLGYSFGGAGDGMGLTVLDSTHPAMVARVRDSLDLEHTLFIVASKSGTTVESMSHFGYFYSLVENPEQFVAITDPGTRLQRLGQLMGFRAVFLNASDIGGRYSALSLFGLVPAALIGMDMRELLEQAEELECACQQFVPADENPGAWLGAALGAAAKNGRHKLTLVLPESVKALGSWIEQLVAESTGKEGTGILPVVGEDLGSVESYGDDRIFVSLGRDDRLEPLAKAGHPVIEIDFAEPIELGGEFYRWEFATAVAGSILGVNPFDQPNVASAKEATKQILASEKAEEPQLGDLDALLESVSPGDYVAILAYIDRTDEAAEALQEARLAIRDKYRVATTVGIGPRYLHSTGQLHKGGPGYGAFIQVVDTDPGEDLPIPDADYSFGELIRAQALGDLRSLRDSGRRVARVSLNQLMEVIR